MLDIDPPSLSQNELDTKGHVNKLVLLQFFFYKNHLYVDCYVW